MKKILIALLVAALAGTVLWFIFKPSGKQQTLNGGLSKGGAPQKSGTGSAGNKSSTTSNGLDSLFGLFDAATSTLTNANNSAGNNTSSGFNVAGGDMPTNYNEAQEVLLDPNATAAQQQQAQSIIDGIDASNAFGTTA